MYFSILYYFAWIYFMTFLKTGHGIKNTATLIDELKGRSDSRVSPNDISGVPVTVNVSMFVSNLHEIDETKMEFGMDTYIRKTWMDPRLAFTDGPEMIHFGYRVAKDFIWMPDLFFSQSTSTDITRSYTKDAGVRIKPTGEIVCSVRMSMKIRCKMDLRSFPLDKQTCVFRVSTFMSTAEDVRLQWSGVRPNSTRAVYVTRRKLPPGFVLSDCTTSHDQRRYFRPVDVLTIKFYFDRIRTHYIVLTYIPSFLLVLVSCLIFWLPLTAVTERFLFGSILILSLTQVLTHSQDQAPQVGYLKAIDVWVVSCYFFICVALMEVVLLYLVAKRVSGTKDDQIELVNNDQLSNGGTEGDVGKSKGFFRGSWLQKIDLVLRFLYPAAFLLFNIVYWPVFAYHWKLRFKQMPNEANSDKLAQPVIEN